ncbi:hypothetical protein D0T12_18470 [Actinomadura spongiicola]|uniref:Uncharacterized protein n=1 Tax=Actinomadura spongiicola TaxID=2303421 RepID=A0A372GGE3_9ACTN|nr:hypothetical protein [Actinomadura spongiicola]RFS84143.1 hypothetical protein D0T12_18470 [Actinomadura spongiicola]
MHTLQRLYRTKLALLATITTGAGVGMLFLAQWATNAGPLWLHTWPLTEIGATLLSTGLIVIAFEYLDREDSEARAMRRLDQAITAKAPAIRDAVIQGFAFNADDLARVASPETLDEISRNVLALQLGDRQLAEDVHGDLRQQVIRSPERRSDADVSIDLAPWEDGPASGEDAMFVATVRWEYRTARPSPVMRFSAVSDPEEYRELLDDPTSSLAWFFKPTSELHGGSAEAFQLVQFTMDGESCRIRHSKRRTSQTYMVDLAAVRDEKPAASASPREVTIAYTYKVLVRRHGHLFALKVGALTNGFKVALRYGGCGIRSVSTLDFIASAEPTRLAETPESVPTPAVELSFDGWVLPRSGVVFAWRLE